MANHGFIQIALHQQSHLFVKIQNKQHFSQSIAFSEGSQAMGQITLISRYYVCLVTKMCHTARENSTLWETLHRQLIFKEQNTNYIFGK